MCDGGIDRFIKLNCAWGGVDARGGDDMRVGMGCIGIFEEEQIFADVLERVEGLVIAGLNIVYLVGRGSFVMKVCVYVVYINIRTRKVSIRELTS